MFSTHYYVFLRKHFLYFPIILTTFAPAIRQQPFHPTHCDDVFYCTAQMRFTRWLSLDL